MSNTKISALEQEKDRLTIDFEALRKSKPFNALNQTEIDTLQNLLDQILDRHSSTKKILKKQQENAIAEQKVKEYDARQKEHRRLNEARNNNACCPICNRWKLELWNNPPGDWGLAVTAKPRIVCNACLKKRRLKLVDLVADRNYMNKDTFRGIIRAWRKQFKKENVVPVFVEKKSTKCVYVLAKYSKKPVSNSTLDRITGRNSKEPCFFGM